MKIQDLQNIINHRFDLVHKSVGVVLHDCGFMCYKKLTEENYDYWWYEVEDPKNEAFDKKLFTYDWEDMELTRKFEWLKNLVKYHRPEEDLHRLINNVLNIESACHDGVNADTGMPAWQEVFNMYYAKKIKQNRQLELF